ncbi:hypothetical protein [Microvirga massiliensis]|uniref:hypothetical protein n=1 Tax=Microvirga massiliensis TaxID=1033741 RepID=UPI00062BCEF6|nr:hypothetical protein [Microvirga massiliensis]
MIARGTGHETKWLRRLRGLGTLLRYKAGWLEHDIVAGLVLATILVLGPDSALAAVILGVLIASLLSGMVACSVLSSAARETSLVWATKPTK